MRFQQYDLFDKHSLSDHLNQKKNFIASMYHYNEESGPQAVFIYERRRVREDGSSVTMALP